MQQKRGGGQHTPSRKKNDEEWFITFELFFENIRTFCINYWKPMDQSGNQKAKQQQAQVNQGQFNSGKQLEIERPENGKLKNVMSW